MIPFKIGNWLIDEDCIRWNGESKINYKIKKDRLLESGPRESIYDWLFHMPEKAWLSREDIYALNTAFIYALEYFEIQIPDEKSFVETFIEQEKRLEGK